MAEERIQRRLAAILSADVVGYSRLMGIDEAGTLSRLNALRRELIDPTIAAHSGRIVKLMGDGALVEFASAVNAVTCAIEIQRQLRERDAGGTTAAPIQFRIGINVGDIIIEGDDILGDGVNIAARIEGITEAGGISISEDAWRQVQGKVAANFVDAGEQTLKNITRPVRVYRLELGPKPTSAIQPPPALALPDRPSIAILPFQNMSGDPEQEYFADGIVEDIITALSRLRWLLVIARNSSFTYKGRVVDVRQVGRDLGVRYVLEGSVRKAASRVRITGQLIDTTTGAHLWANRFDGGLEEIFDLQDQVTASVVSAIAPKVEQAEIERAKRKPTESLDAYDYYLRGIARFYRGTRNALSDALELFQTAIALDPEFPAAYGMAAWCYMQRKNNGWMIDRVEETASAERLAWHAVRFGKDDPIALYTGGWVLAQVEGQLEAGAAMIARALTLDPNLAAAWHSSGWVRIYLGEPETAIEHIEHAMRLSPLDPLFFGMLNGMAAAHFLAGRYDKASSWAEKALRDHPNYLPALRMSAASNALAGRLAHAQKAMARMRQFDPGLRVTGLKDVIPFRGPEDCARYVQGLRTAGLPD